MKQSSSISPVQPAVSKARRRSRTARDGRSFRSALATNRHLSVDHRSPTRAPMLTKLGISAAPGATWAPRRTLLPEPHEMQLPRTHLSPIRRISKDLVPPVSAAGTAADRFHRVQPEENQHDFFSHWWTVHAPSSFSAIHFAVIERRNRRIDNPGERRPCGTDRLALVQARSISPAGRPSFLVPQNVFQWSPTSATRTSTSASSPWLPRSSRCPQIVCPELLRGTGSAPCRRPKRVLRIDPETVTQERIACGSSLGR